ncbi:MAG: DUF3604 domain-containing protein [Armatimonadetes bacterium]|nr:DUF3604 domain-containing protein [Armatimonadota bacterium]
MLALLLALAGVTHAQITPIVAQRTIFRTSFEANEPVLDSAVHKHGDGMGRTGTRAFTAELLQAGKQAIARTDFSVTVGARLVVRCYVRSDKGSGAALYLNVDGNRQELARLSTVVPGDWRRLEGSWLAGGEGDRVRGQIEFVAPDTSTGPPGRVWIDDILVEELPAEQPPYTASVEDHPALCATSGGDIFMAVTQRIPGSQIEGKPFVGVYRVDEQRRVLVARLGDDQTTGVGAPAIAASTKGCWVAAAVERGDRWRIDWLHLEEGKVVTRGSAEAEAAANCEPEIAADGKNALLVWEANPSGQRAVYAATLSADRTGPPQRLSPEGTNSYRPAVVVPANGEAFVAWDAFADGQADLWGCRRRVGVWQKATRLTADPRVERRVALASYGDEVWLAWQAQSYPGLRVNLVGEQRIVVARLGAPRLGIGALPIMEMPSGLFSSVSKPREPLLRPRLSFDEGGRMWLTARRSSGIQAGWHALAWCYTRDGWYGPIELLDADGRSRGVDLTWSPRGGVVAVQYDTMPDTTDNRGLDGGWQSGISLRRLVRRPQAGSPELVALAMPTTEFDLAKRRAIEAVGLPRAGQSHGKQALSLYWGDLHEHTDISTCERRLNPGAAEVYANLRDIEQMDFVAITDHDYSLDGPQWAVAGEQARLARDAGRFEPFVGQEWSSSSARPAAPGEPRRYGHRSLIFGDLRPPRYYNSFDGSPSPAALWEALGGQNYLCIPHQLADWEDKGRDNPPVDWRMHDEQRQPVAELMQARGSYEALGAPRQAAQGTPFRGYWAQDLWAKGLVFGVIGGADHGGGSGKAGVWAPDMGRDSLLAAIRARHTYATSGPKTTLWFSCGDAMMGDRRPHPAGPLSFRIQAQAPAAIRTVTLLRNNEPVLQTEPDQRAATLDWTDQSPPAGRLWYYARIETVDEHVAVASPIWFEP